MVSGNLRNVEGGGGCAASEAVTKRVERHLVCGRKVGKQSKLLYIAIQCSDSDPENNPQVLDLAAEAPAHIRKHAKVLHVPLERIVVQSTTW